KKNRKNIKASGEKQFVFLHLLHFKDLSDKPFFWPLNHKLWRTCYGFISRPWHQPSYFYYAFLF
ncbi:hypothetical protein, partial [Scopulibacillus daqui]